MIRMVLIGLYSRGRLGSRLVLASINESFIYLFYVTFTLCTLLWLFITIIHIFHLRQPPALHEHGIFPAY